MSRLWTYVVDRAEFICECGVGHYPVWVKDQTHGECPRHCCIGDDFPGRAPRRGDFALCGKGSLGIVLAPNKRHVYYPGGGDSLAWVGFHLTNAICALGNQWSSRNPIIIGNIAEFAFTRNNNIDWAETIYGIARQRVIENWPWKQPRTELTAASRKMIDECCNFCVEE